MNLTWIEPQWGRLSGSLGQLPHALLIHGPRGVGKLALATRFANLLLCESPASNNPCGRCEGCRWFRDGNHPDFRLIQPESMADEVEPEEGAREEERPGKKAKPSNEIKVAQIRGLADFLYVGSHRGARRVALVHPAEAMNLNAANALLKGLEEPPRNAVFILVTNASSRLLPTVRSRCVQLAVPVPDDLAARAWLAANGVAQPDRWLAFAGGAPLLALDLAKGERSAELALLLDAVASGDAARISPVSTRESMELLAEVLQKTAYDAVFSQLAGRTKYGTRGSRPAGENPTEWLRYARTMGWNRALARRPLNPGLFSADMLAALPARSKSHAKH